MSEEQVFVEPVRPLPSVIASFREDMVDPIDWDIVPSLGEAGSGVDFASGVLAVPLTGDAHSQREQLRGLVQLRCSPLDDNIFKEVAKQYKDYGITENVLRAAEAARISAITEQFATAKKLEREVDGSEKVLGKRLATANSTEAWDKAVEFTLRNYDSKSFDSFCAGIRSVNSDWSEQLRRLNKRLKDAFDSSAMSLGSTERTTFGGVSGPLGFQHTLYGAEVVREYLSGGYKAPQQIRLMREQQEEKRAQEYGQQPQQQAISQRGTLTPDEVELEDDLPDDFGFSSDGDEFHKLIIDESLPLTMEVAGYMHRKRRAMVSGRRIAYPGRMLSDPQRRVFGSKVKVKGGIVVIDISGSMSLQTSDIEAIVEAAPAAVIIAYSTCSREENAWVLANRGWRVREIPDDIGGGSNGVDGPALAWAIRHRKHGEDIVWVSDGQVNGTSGADDRQLAIQCAKLVRKHRIKMIPSVREAVTMFKSGSIINKPAGLIRAALLGKL